jgi:hypothetical protein
MMDRKRRDSNKYPIGLKFVLLLFAIAVTVSLLEQSSRREGSMGGTSKPVHVITGSAYQPGP